MLTAFDIHVNEFHSFTLNVIYFESLEYIFMPKRPDC